MINEARLIEENEYIIYHIINKYSYYFDKDDLYQVGMLGLLNACRHYDNGKNTKFSSFAYFYVLGEVTKYIRDSNFLKVSKDLVKLNSSIEKARDYLTQKIGYVPSNDEIALFLEIDVSKINEAEIANSLITSLDNDVNANNEPEIYNYYGYCEKGYNEEILDLKTELDKLNEFDRELITKRYNEGLSQSEVSKELGINQVKVSRCEKQILTKLRTRLK